MNLGEWERISRVISLTGASMVRILYLHGEKFQVLGYVTVLGIVEVKTTCARTCRNRTEKARSLLLPGISLSCRSTHRFTCWHSPYAAHVTVTVGSVMSHRHHGEGAACSTSSLAGIRKTKRHRAWLGLLKPKAHPN